MPQTWITSDTHFGHKNIRTYTDRHLFWHSTEEMSENILANINEDVAEDDTLIINGDVVMGLPEENLKRYVARIRCKNIMLILGNHDRPLPTKKNLKRFEEMTELYKQYFAWMGPSQLMPLAGIVVEFNHFPFAGDHTEQDRYPDFRPVDKGQWLIHGHVHTPQILTGPRSIHVGIDANYTSYGIRKYHPIPLEVIETIIKEHT